MNETTTATAGGKLERKTCGRCGGTGHYSYCQRWGTTCFGCGGQKEVLTKRGAAANEYLVRLRSKPAGELIPGDVVLWLGLTLGGDPYHAWFKVESIGPDEARGRSFINGVEIPPRTDLLYVRLARHGKGSEDIDCYGVTPEQLVRVAQTAARKAETLRLALEYQATLTQAGTPRKTRGGK
jgi:hypothetical protein